MQSDGLWLLESVEAFLFPKFRQIVQNSFQDPRVAAERFEVAFDAVLRGKEGQAIRVRDGDADEVAFQRVAVNVELSEGRVAEVDRFHSFFEDDGSA